MCATCFETITDLQKCSKKVQIHFLHEILESKLLPQCPMTIALEHVFPVNILLPASGQSSGSGAALIHHCSGVLRPYSSFAGGPHNILYGKG